MSKTITRRAVLAGTALLPSLSARSQFLPPSAVLAPGLIDAAAKEATVVWHTSIDLEVCKTMIAGFNARHPGIAVQLERSGAERILQRINQEYGSNIFAADVVETSDSGTFHSWSSTEWMAQFVPPDVASWPAEERDPAGRFASLRASMAGIAFNTRQVKPEDAPASFADLLQPRWRMRLVKSHPSYSGGALTATHAMVRALGWDYFEKLQKQRVMQVQSATEPPKKVSLGERSVQVDGAEYVSLNLQDAGEPIQMVYAAEGTPIYSGSCCVMQKAPHPNAARLFVSYLFSADCQQRMVDKGNLRSFHPDVKDKPGHRKLAEIKLLRTNASELARDAEALKQRYAQIFGV